MVERAVDLPLGSRLHKIKTTTTRPGQKHCRFCNLTDPFRRNTGEGGLVAGTAALGTVVVLVLATAWAVTALVVTALQWAITALATIEAVGDAVTMAEDMGDMAWAASTGSVAFASQLPSARSVPSVGAVREEHTSASLMGVGTLSMRAK